MPIGGKREGAGRPKGAVAKVTAEARRKAIEGGITPLEYMLGVMRDDKADQKRRDDMAKGAAAYVHARAVEHTGRGGGPIQTIDLTKATDAEIRAIEAVFGPLAERSGSDEGGTG